MNQKLAEAIVEARKTKQEILALERSLSGLKSYQKQVLNQVYQDYIQQSKELNDLNPEDLALVVVAECDRGCHQNFKIVCRIELIKNFSFTNFVENFEEKIGLYFKVQQVYPNTILPHCVSYLDWFDDNQEYLGQRNLKYSELQKISKAQFLAIQKEDLEKEIENLNEKE